MQKKTKNKDTEKKVKELIKELEYYSSKEYLEKHSWDEAGEEAKKTIKKIASIGKPAVPDLIRLLKRGKAGCWYAVDALGEIKDEGAMPVLVDELESEINGGSHDFEQCVKESLKKFGPACIPEVIKKVEYRIANPVKTRTNVSRVTSSALDTIGEIKCDESIKFLNKLLDGYMSEIPDEPFDVNKYEWKYRNVHPFHLLDCMVRQQDKRAIPHIKKARDAFPKGSGDYKICQLAIKRIEEGIVAGYLTLESLDMALGY